jgi:hypothetical protein
VSNAKVAGRKSESRVAVDLTRLGRREAAQSSLRLFPSKKVSGDAMNHNAEPQPTPVNDDAQLVAELARVAQLLLPQGDEGDRRAGEIISRFASIEGKRLRLWMISFKDRQAKASARSSASDDVTQVEGEKTDDWIGRICAAPDEGVVTDENGRPAIINTAAYLERLAYFLASQRLPRPWQRSDSTYLKTVAAKSRELSTLLGCGGPKWRVAIELFDPQARPVWDNGGNYADFQRVVSDRLRKQALSDFLTNLADEADRLDRLTALDSAVLHTPRPDSKNAFDRFLAREIRGWFRNQCSGVNPSNELFADVISMARTNGGHVTGAQVREWLRPPRQ